MAIRTCNPQHGRRSVLPRIADPCSVSRCQHPGPSYGAVDPTATPQAVIQIEDNRTYEEDVSVVYPTTAVPPGQPSPCW